MTIPDDRLVALTAGQAGEAHVMLTVFEHMLAWLLAEGDPATITRLQGWTARLTGGGDLSQLAARVTAAGNQVATALTGQDYT